MVPVHPCLRLSVKNLPHKNPGLGQFGAAVSATSRFGDGGRKCFIRKKCVFLKYFEG